MSERSFPHAGSSEATAALVHATVNATRSRPRIAIALVLLWAAACADVAMDQDGEDQIPESPRLPLGPPTAVFAGEFGYLHAVRELPDGDVLVADLLDEAVFRVDMETQTRTMVGGRGEGPDEYLAPDAVWPLPGDSTLLVDVGSGRLVRIGPDLAFGATRSMTVRPEAGSLVLAVPHAVDRHGYIYTTPEPWPPTGADTATILRIDPVRETVDSLRPIRTMWAGFFMPHDAWGVAADGSVVVARAEAYGVDWLSPDGSVIRGDTVPYAPVPSPQPRRPSTIATCSATPGSFGVWSLVRPARASFSTDAIRTWSRSSTTGTTGRT